MKHTFISGANLSSELFKLMKFFVSQEKAFRAAEKDFIVKLTFSNPVTLHHSKKYRDDKLAEVHTVRSIFFTAGGVCNCMHEGTQPQNIYYIPEKMRRGGFSLPLNELLEVELIDATKDYSKDWKAIAESMKKNNINPDTVKAIEDHLSGKTEHIEGFQNYWKKNQKPRIMSFKDVTKGMTLDEMKSQARPSNGSNYTYFNRRIDGRRRDRSVSAQFNFDGTVRLYAASEFSGCGNGDYYEMFSLTRAFYAESD